MSTTELMNRWLRDRYSFDESKVNRDSDGQFAEKPGSKTSGVASGVNDLLSRITDTQQEEVFDFMDSAKESLSKEDAIGLAKEFGFNVKSKRQALWRVEKMLMDRLNGRKPASEDPKHKPDSGKSGAVRTLKSGESVSVSELAKGQSAGSVCSALRQQAESGNVELIEHRGPLYELSPEMERAAFIHNARVIVGVRAVRNSDVNLEPSQPVTGDQLSELEQKVQQFKRSNPQRSISFHELQQGTGLSSSRFVDAMTQLESEGRVSLEPWTRALSDIPDESAAIMSGKEVKYYADPVASKYTIESMNRWLRDRYAMPQTDEQSALIADILYHTYGDNAGAMLDQVDRYAIGWNESLHPRKDDGKFTGKGGRSSAQFLDTSGKPSNISRHYDPQQVAAKRQAVEQQRPSEDQFWQQATEQFRAAGGNAKTRAVQAKIAKLEEKRAKLGEKAEAKRASIAAKVYPDQKEAAKLEKKRDAAGAKIEANRSKEMARYTGAIEPLQSQLQTVTDEDDRYDIDDQLADLENEHDDIIAELDSELDEINELEDEIQGYGDAAEEERANDLDELDDDIEYEDAELESQIEAHQARLQELTDDAISDLSDQLQEAESEQFTPTEERQYDEDQEIEYRAETRQSENEALQQQFADMAANWEFGDRDWQDEEAEFLQRARQLMADRMKEDRSLTRQHANYFLQVARERYAAKFDELKHKRDAAGRFAKKNESVAAIHDAIKTALSGGQHSPESVQGLADNLSQLTVRELTDLKKQYGISAAGRSKADLVAKVADRLSRGRREAEQQPAASQDARSQLLSGLDSVADPEIREQFRAATESVLNAMPQVAHDRMTKHLKEVEYHQTRDEVHSAIGAVSKQARDAIASGREVGGAWKGRSGTLMLDGGTKRKSAAEIYAHEFMHAVDGMYKQELTLDPEWTAAFESEGSVSNYGNTSPQESFAEFGRLMYALNIPTAKLQAKFPKAMAFMQKHGLLPGEATGPEQPVTDIFEGQPTNEGDTHTDHLASTAEEPEPDVYAPESLFSLNQGLVNALASKMGDRHQQDELRQVGRIALWKASQQWKPDSGTKFSTFAYTGIAQAIKNAQRTEGRQKSKAQEFGVDEEGGDQSQQVPGRDAAPDEDMEKQEQLGQLQDAMKQLQAKSPDAAKMVMMKFSGKKLGEIAAEFGITEQGASQAVSRAVKKLQTMMGADKMQRTGDIVRYMDAWIRERYAIEKHDEQAALIADILSHIYGDEAATILDAPDQYSLPQQMDMWIRERYGRQFDESQVKRDEKGRFATRAGKLANVATSIQNALQQPKTPQSARALADELSQLTVKELTDLKKQYQISASGRTKADLVQKLASRLDMGRREEQPKRPEMSDPSETLDADFVDDHFNGDMGAAIEAMERNRAEQISTAAKRGVEYDTDDIDADWMAEVSGMADEDEEPEPQPKPAKPPANLLGDDDDEPFALQQPRKGRKQEKFETAPSGPQGALFDTGKNDLEGQNLLFNSDAGAGENDPTTMENRMKNVKPKGFSRHLGRDKHGVPTVGERFEHDGQMYQVTSVEKPRHYTRDQAADLEDFGHFGVKAGWHVDFTSKSVERNEKERAALQKKADDATQKQREKDDELSAYKSISEADGMESDEVWPLAGTDQPKWELTHEDKNKSGYGTSYYTGKLPNGERVAKKAMSMYDDFREMFYTPSNLKKGAEGQRRDKERLDQLFYDHQSASLKMKLGKDAGTDDAKANLKAAESTWTKAAQEYFKKHGQAVDRLPPEMLERANKLRMGNFYTANPGEVTAAKQMKADPELSQQLGEYIHFGSHAEELASTFDRITNEVNLERMDRLQTALVGVELPEAVVNEITADVKRSIVYEPESIVRKALEEQAEKKKKPEPASSNREQKTPPKNTTKKTGATSATFAKLRDGSWGLRVIGPVQAGDSVKVKKKDGSSQTKKVKSVVKEFNDATLVSFYGMQPSEIEVDRYSHLTPRGERIERLVAMMAAGFEQFVNFAGASGSGVPLLSQPPTPINPWNAAYADATNQDSDKQLSRYSFKESDHPRGDGGKFAEKAGNDGAKGASSQTNRDAGNYRTTVDEQGAQTVYVPVGDITPGELPRTDFKLKKGAHEDLDLLLSENDWTLDEALQDLMSDSDGGADYFESLFPRTQHLEEKYYHALDDRIEELLSDYPDAHVMIEGVDPNYHGSDVADWEQLPGEWMRNIAVPQMVEAIRQQYADKQLSRYERKSSGWITLNAEDGEGTKVFLGEGGEVTAGPKE